jgi:tripartite-type tricarboxylate transporter receptor subunit TctC
MGHADMAFLLRSAVIWLGLTAGAAAEELKIIVHTVSGGHMIHARVFAQHLQKYSGQPVTIKAVPGAAGVAAANYLYNVAPKDGTEIGTIDSRVPVQFLAKGEGVKYDISKFGWLGSAVDGRREPFVFWAKAGSDPLVAGTEGGSSINHIRLINSVLRWDMKEVVGYTDSAQAKLAFERGEINLVAYNLTGIRTTSPAWLTDTSILPMIQYGNGRIRHKNLPFVTTAMELASSEDDQRLVEAFERLLILVRPFAAPPGVPELRLAYLRTLFERTVTDQEYQADAVKIGVVPSPLSWNETQEIVRSMVSTDPKIVRRISEFQRGS